MPTTTFLNLPPEKQERLLDAATRELSEKPYNEASINKIIQEAGVPRGSFYMYFQDKEDLFRYLVRGYMDQMVMLLEESLLREQGDIFAALLRLFDYTREKREEHGLGGIGAMAVIVGQNNGMQKTLLLEMVDTQAVLARLRETVNPDLLDLRQDRDLGDVLGILLTVTGPMLYSGLQAGGAPDVRERLENVLQILRRGLGKDKDSFAANSTEKGDHNHA